MRLTGILLSTAVVFCTVATSARAVDWSKADALYSQRENNRDAIAQARADYLAILSQATAPEDKVRAVSQLGRLAIYEGSMLLPAGDAARKAVFAECWCRKPHVTIPFFSGRCDEGGFVDEISPAKLGHTEAAYYYYHSACLGYWGEVANLSEQKVFSGTLKSDIQDAYTNKVDLNFEGGGILRVEAGIYSNPAASAVGLYNPKLALTRIDAALRATDGNRFYDNVERRADVLRQLAVDEPTGRPDASSPTWKELAQSYTKAKLAEMDDIIDAEDYPLGRKAEFLFNYGQLKDIYQGLTGQTWTH